MGVGRGWGSGSLSPRAPGALRARPREREDPPGRPGAQPVLTQQQTEQAERGPAPRHPAPRARAPASQHPSRAAPERCAQPETRSARGTRCPRPPPGSGVGELAFSPPLPLYSWQGRPLSLAATILSFPAQSHRRRTLAGAGVAAVEAKKGGGLCGPQTTRSTLYRGLSYSFKLDFHLTFNPFVSAWPVPGAGFLGVPCVFFPFCFPLYSTLSREQCR